MLTGSTTQIYIAGIDILSADGDAPRAWTQARSTGSLGLAMIVATLASTAAATASSSRAKSAPPTVAPAGSRARALRSESTSEIDNASVSSKMIASLHAVSTLTGVCAAAHSQR